MLTKRIIPCLDIKEGRTVKGVNFIDIKDAGDPVALAVQYTQQGADELVLLDITATVEKRLAFTEIIKSVAASINIPFTVGGGISNSHDAELLIKNGADKVSINSAAVRNPLLITELCKSFGSQAVVIAIDTRKESDGNWYVYLNGGRLRTNLKTSEWAKMAVELGAGEILLTSMNDDGAKNGFALDITKAISKLSVPVIASGGAGLLSHFKDVFIDAGADAALAASIFHYNEIPIPQLKQYLYEQNIPVRI